MTATIQRIATELSVRPEQVAATVKLLDDGSTVPFVARYRKEATGGLDDTQLRKLEERLGYLRELDERRTTILASIGEQGKLTPDLERAIGSAGTKQALEDLYLPYRQKRRTKAMIAREAGLEPLAKNLLADPTQDPAKSAEQFVAPDKGVADATEALEGARFILAEEFAEDAALIGEVRQWLTAESRMVTKVNKSKADDPEAQRYRDYFAHAEPLGTIAGHRALAILRARKEGFLDAGLGLETEGDDEGAPPPVTDDPTSLGQRLVMERFGIAEQGRPADTWLANTARIAFRARIATHVETDLMSTLREQAEAEAIMVFAQNLRDLLLAAPAGPKAILGIDPGLRTGCKVAVVDRTGKLLDTATIYPHVPRNDWIGSMQTLTTLCKKHEVALISIGNGTASRETDKLAAELVRQNADLELQKLVVSEAGASVYSASELAAKEFPNVDVTLRGAASIARRLQDPLAELVKIEPKAIGVGQYQHDVNQSRLKKSLDAVVEDCVNHVGVDLNTASAALLGRVAGLSTTLASNIVKHRDDNGPFLTRRELLKVSRLGPKAFEQCAGFLRIPDGKDALDRSAVHPEAYPVVERILQQVARPLPEVLGNSELLRGLRPDDFVDERFGVPTVADILAELEKPGRDPRPEFKTAAFQDDVQELTDLKRDMVLEGVVSNVTAFGAFVDIGVHQDGLVHISQLADRFVEDPREVVKAGQIVKVKVLDIDLERRRVALTMKLHERTAGGERSERQPGGNPGRNPGSERGTGRPNPGGNNRRDRGQRPPRDGHSARPTARDAETGAAAPNPLAQQLSKLNLRKN